MFLLSKVNIVRTKLFIITVSLFRKTYRWDTFDPFGLRTDKAKMTLWTGSAQ